ncbi:hypothetical protein [Dictyobacter formicarum]|uniref:hypothetical protein n=1 Tax=Dictyobacter formicarum TaxID=2778368 RepID=UPI0019155A4E|nr:hypothetical protein [Dictyobacter formicarum]
MYWILARVTFHVLAQRCQFFDQAIQRPLLGKLFLCIENNALQDLDAPGGKALLNRRIGYTVESTSSSEPSTLVSSVSVFLIGVLPPRKDPAMPIAPGPSLHTNCWHPSATLRIPLPAASSAAGARPPVPPRTRPARRT